MIKKIIIMRSIAMCLLISVMFYGLTSCSKETLTSGSTEFLKFENEEDYDECLMLVSLMSDKEFVEWEKSKNFTSFYTTAIYIYAAINPEELEGIDDIKRYVRENSNFLQLISDGNGELILETLLYKRSKAEQRLLNRDKLVQVGESIYKVFETGVAKVAYKDLREIQNMTEKHFTVGNFSEKIEVKKRPNANSKDILAKEHSSWITNNRDRLYLGIEIQFTIPFSSANYATKYSIEYTVRPYMRTLGVWYWCTRTISAHIDCGFHYYGLPGANYISKSWLDVRLPQKVSVFENRYLVSHNEVNNGGNVFYGFYWDYIYCWAESASVPGQRCIVNEWYN